MLMADGKQHKTALKERAEKFKGSKARMEGGRSLLPKWLLFAAFMISFALPNLVFSGRQFFDTLHIMKWTVTMVPIGVLAIVAGVRLAVYGAKRLSFSLDLFGAIWLALLVFITCQPFFVELPSRSTFVKEWFYFASLFAVYYLALNAFKSSSFHVAVLWGGTVNAAINVVFAEMLMRDLNRGLPFILDVPGNYIGNTAQQEMFGLWMAMAVFNCIYIHISRAQRSTDSKSLFKQPLTILNLLVLAIDAWGLWNSTARGGILSLAVAFVFFVICLWRTDSKKALRHSFALIVAVLLVIVAVFATAPLIGSGRGAELVSKMTNMVTHPADVAGRTSIWRTSWEVYLKHPISGVGLGQYKWNFLDGQRIMYEKHPELYEDPRYNWQFTYWAHSEYLQWLAETGSFGAAALLLLGVWWLYSFVYAMIKKKQISFEAIWGVGMTFLLWFDALFSRPFHRIENSVWMALAFAIANREVLTDPLRKIAIGDRAYKVFGAVSAAAAMYGLYFLYGGIVGDQLIFASITQPRSFSEKMEMLRRAETYLMAEDDALEQQAKLLVNVGKVQRNNGMQEEASANIARGIDAMLASFSRAPTSQMLFEILGIAQEAGAQDVLRYLARYLSPSMYRVEHAPPKVGEISDEER